MGRRPDPKPTEHVAKSGRTTYRVRVRLDGKHTSETFDTKAEAQTFCDDVRNRGVAEAIRLRELSLIQPEHADLTSPTLDVVFEEFLKWKTPRVQTGKTVEDYRSHYDRVMKPHLGNKPIATITPGDIQKWVDSLLTGEGQPQAYDPKTILNRHGTLHSVFKFAAHPNQGYVTANPCSTTELPKRRKGQPKGLRPAEWQAVYAALQQINADAADLAFFLVSTGWRWGEATALSTYDVEDDGTRMWIAVTRVARRVTKGTIDIVEDAAKSEDSMRRIEIDTDTAAVVRRRVAKATPGDLVFTTVRGSMWRPSHFRDYAWKPAVATAKLSRKPTPHWLRHSHVFWNATTGETTLQELGRRIGHKQIGTTMNVYGRMIGDVRPEALTAFARVRDGAPTPAITQGEIVEGEIVTDDEG